MPPKSKKQARLLGIIAGGGKPRKKTGLSKTKAKEFLKGAKLKRLPLRVKKKKRKRKSR
ncbi:hypothetical protein LCGC14_2808960 [marine sediment metagenome]|uniref:Uncharacterized protein n=1 Tax=marine sediment metagenome TaxID=412755 RepID=A0A0F8Z7C4_9ZZZZ